MSITLYERIWKAQHEACASIRKANQALLAQLSNNISLKLKSGRTADQATRVSVVLYSPKSPANSGVFYYFNCHNNSINHSPTPGTIEGSNYCPKTPQQTVSITVELT